MTKNRYNYKFGIILFEGNAKDAPDKYKNKARKMVIKSMKQFFEEKSIKDTCTISQYRPGKYRSFWHSYSADLHSRWPWGTAGDVWLGVVPEKDYI